MLPPTIVTGGSQDIKKQLVEFTVKLIAVGGDAEMEL